MATPAIDLPTHIYHSNLIDTLCGEPNKKEQLNEGYFFVKHTALLYYYGFGHIQITDEPIRSKSRLQPNAALGKLPEMEEDVRHIIVPGVRSRFTVRRMCNDCLALHRLQELE